MCTLYRYCCNPNINRQPGDREEGREGNIILLVVERIWYIHMYVHVEVEVDGANC